MRPPGERGRGPAAGSTLAEVVVGVLVLEVGLLATAGMLVHAAASLAEAERREAAVQVAREVSDSLALAGATGAGSLRRDGLEVEWRGGASAGSAEIEVRGAEEGPVLLRLHARPPRSR